jgi:hypothetical protein
MHSAGLLAFDPDPMPEGSGWVQPPFIDTDDNRAALVLGQPYTAPMQTVARMRRKAVTTSKQWQAVVKRGAQPATDPLTERDLGLRVASRQLLWRM